jgi:predicted secreted hydrolase
MKRVLLILVALVISAIVLVLFIGSARPPAISAEVVNLQALKSTAGFALAQEPRTLSFPQDHGPHPEFQTEWWYYTGNLDTTDGRHLGYQLTFFRRAITPTAPSRASDWATNQIYFAHFAITDVKNGTHFVAERFSRGAAGLAGASGDPYRVWIDDWRVSSLDADGATRLRSLWRLTSRRCCMGKRD